MIRSSDLPPHLRELVAEQTVERVRRNKYGVADKADRSYNGVVYDSQAEMKRAKELDLMKRSGSIMAWHYHPVYRLSDAQIRYEADFVVTDLDGVKHAEEIKGLSVGRWPTIKKLWRTYGPWPLHVCHKGKWTIIEPRKATP